MFQPPGSTSSSSNSIDVDYLNIPEFHLPRDYNTSFSRPLLRNPNNRIDYNNFSSENPFLLEDSYYLPSLNFLGNRRRRIHNQEISIENSLNENTNNLSIQDEYIDFRNYPIPIDWYDCEERNFGYGCEILELFGNFGLALYSKLKFIKLPVIPEGFLRNVLEYYYNEKLHNKHENILKFVENLPTLDDINTILRNKLFIEKEILPIKIVLDIYENYFNFNIIFYEIIKNKFFPIVFEFYNSITYQQLENMYSKLVNERGYYKKISEKKIIVFKRKDNYIDYYKHLKQDYLMIFEGINTNKFTL